MARLLFLVLGQDYLWQRWRGLAALGGVWLVAGLVLFGDALDGALYFPLSIFAWLFLLEGVATVVLARLGVGAQRGLRYARGGFMVVAALSILAGNRHGDLVLSLIFGALFLADGSLQCTAAYVVRYRRWRAAFAWGILEILIAVFFFQPYPTAYAGTLPYALGLLLMFGGMNLLQLALRARRSLHASLQQADPSGASAILPAGLRHATVFGRSSWDGPPQPGERAITVHVWTPTGSSKAPTRNQPLIDRYIAAVDVNGVISTGHAALESPEGIYISLYPRVEIDRNPADFARLLRATSENDMPGMFQPDYVTEAKTWCPSSSQVRIRNYDAKKLEEFWQRYRRNSTYNLTHRNCSSTVSFALEAAIEGAYGRLGPARPGWSALVRLLLTPEFWVAAQIRKRAQTMAWTPGLTLDYARALSMLADPRPFAWRQVLAGTVFGNLK